MTTPTTLAHLDSVGVVATTPAKAPSTLLLDSIGVVLAPPAPVPPGAPYGLVATAGDTEALVSWTAPDGPVDYYVINTADGGGDTFTDSFADSYGSAIAVTVSATSTSVLLTGLANGLTYAVTVTAYSGGLASAPSAPVSVTPQVGADPIVDPNLPPPDPVDPDDLIDPALKPVDPVRAPEVFAAQFSFPVFGVPQGPLLIKAPVTAAPTKVGHLQSVWFEKIDNRQVHQFTPFGQPALDPADPSTVTKLVGQALYLLPSRGGLWVTAFDSGYPQVQAISTAWPDRDGELDYTDRFGSRNMTLNILAEPWRGVDANGVLQPTQAWVDLVRSWSSLDNNLRLHWQLTGRHPMWVDVRTAQLGAPISMEELGRLTAQITWGLYSADGTVYGEVLPGYLEDQARPGWYKLTVNTGQSGSALFNFVGGSTWAGGHGMNFLGGSTWKGGDGMNFGGGASYGGPVVSVPQETVGSRKSQPVITISGGSVTGPVISIWGSNNQVMRSRLQFSAGLVIGINDVVVIDVQNRRVVRNPDRFGNGELLYKYLTGVVDWRNFYIDPNDSNAFAFGGASVSGAVAADISYRSTYV